MRWCSRYRCVARPRRGAAPRESAAATPAARFGRQKRRRCARSPARLPTRHDNDDAAPTSIAWPHSEPGQHERAAAASSFARRHGVPMPASSFPRRSLASTAPSSRTRTVVRAVLIFDSPLPPLHDRTRTAHATTPRAIACCAKPPPCSNERGPTTLTEDAVLFPPFNAGHAAARGTHSILSCARRVPDGAVACGACAHGFLPPSTYPPYLNSDLVVFFFVGAPSVIVYYSIKHGPLYLLE
ncbi:hypothetical protein BC834DRAFT_903327 [Gloeopeniophorella convolvens]|nr:hypothetical protein BC834DRAFT_903327 [Gloeopeniophorella convolvens]